jgi:hypothetical protein
MSADGTCLSSNVSRLLTSWRRWLTVGPQEAQPSRSKFDATAMIADPEPLPGRDQFGLVPRR